MRITGIKAPLVLLGLALLLLAASAPAGACSRLLWNDNDQAVLLGRTMDWYETNPTDLWAFPPGIERNGKVGPNSLAWTSRYASLAASSYGICTVDGINEKGLGVTPLWLGETDYGKRDPAVPGMSWSYSTQFFLDNFASVAEAVAYVRSTPFQFVSGPVGSKGKSFKCHLALADASGDSAIIEWIAGKPRVYHGREYTVATNSPTYAKQLADLRRYRVFGGTLALPGGVTSEERFVRGARFLDGLPRPGEPRQAMYMLLSVIRTISPPFGTQDRFRPKLDVTRWLSISDLSHLVYYFQFTTSPSLIWVGLGGLDLKPGAPVLKLDLIKRPDRVGDVSAQFKPSEPMVFAGAGAGAE